MSSAAELIERGLQVGDKIIPEPTEPIKNDSLTKLKYEMLDSNTPLTVYSITLISGTTYVMVESEMDDQGKKRMGVFRGEENLWQGEIIKKEIE